jgi:hypothetical protein
MNLKIPTRELLEHIHHISDQKFREQALEKENGDKGTSLLLLAEVELTSQGCGVSKQVELGPLIVPRF